MSSPLFHKTFDITYKLLVLAEIALFYDFYKCNAIAEKNALSIEIEKAGEEFLYDTFKKNVVRLAENTGIKKIKQNLNNLSIIEILKQPYLSLFFGKITICKNLLEK